MTDEISQTPLHETPVSEPSDAPKQSTNVKKPRKSIVQEVQELREKLKQYETNDITEKPVKRKRVVKKVQMQEPVQEESTDEEEYLKIPKSAWQQQLEYTETLKLKKKILKENLMKLHSQAKMNSIREKYEQMYRSPTVTPSTYSPPVETDSTNDSILLPTQSYFTSKVETTPPIPPKPMSAFAQRNIRYAAIDGPKSSLKHIDPVKAKQSMRSKITS